MRGKTRECLARESETGHRVVRGGGGAREEPGRKKKAPRERLPPLCPSCVFAPQVLGLDTLYCSSACVPRLLLLVQLFLLAVWYPSRWPWVVLAGVWLTGLWLCCCLSTMQVISVSMEALWPPVWGLTPEPQGVFVQPGCLLWVRNSLLRSLWRLLVSAIWEHHL